MSAAYSPTSPSYSPTSPGTSVCYAGLACHLLHCLVAHSSRLLLVVRIASSCTSVMTHTQHAFSNQTQVWQHEYSHKPNCIPSCASCQCFKATAHHFAFGTSSILCLVCLLAAYSPTSPSYSPTSPGKPLLHDSALLVFDSGCPYRGFFHFLFCAYVSNLVA